MSEPEPGIRLSINPHAYFTYDMTVVRAEWTIPTANVPLFIEKLTQFDTEVSSHE